MFGESVSSGTKRIPGRVDHRVLPGEVAIVREDDSAGPSEIRDDVVVVVGTAVEPVSDALDVVALRAERRVDGFDVLVEEQPVGHLLGWASYGTTSDGSNERDRLRSIRARRSASSSSITSALS